MSFEKLTKYLEMDNIAEILDEDDLNKIGSDVVSNYEADIRSRKDWKDRYDEAMKLAAQVVEKKSYPWPNAANVKYPLLTEAALQFSARAYPALIPGTDIVKARTVGFDPTGEKNMAAIRVSKHMSYQILEQQDEWEENMDKLLTAIPIIGCMFKKTYYDPNKERNCSIAVYPEHFVVDYDTINLKDAFRKTHVVYYNKNDITKSIRAGIYLDQDLGDPQTDSEQNRLDGSVPTEVNEATPYCLLEQHTYLDLDDDGIAEPYILTVDKASGKVLRIVAGYRREGIKVNTRGEVMDVEQIQYFTKYSFVPSPDGGFYDMGFGQFLGPINHTVDTIINQLLDSGHMSMLGGGFLSRGVRMKQGNMSFKPNEWKVVNSTGDDLRKGIVPLPTKEPSNVMFQLLGMMVQQAQRMASTVDSMVGENPGQNQKATTTLAVIEQGSKVFSGIYKRLHRSLKHEFNLMFDLNAEYMNEQEYFTILDANLPQEHLAQVFQNDYNRELLNIVPAADTSVTSMQQKMMKAQAALELTQTGFVNPQEAVRRMLEAQEQPAIDVLMNVPERGPSLEEQRLQLDKLRFQLDVLIAQQNDVKIQAGAIKDLATAEAAELGSQLNEYKLILDQLNLEAKEKGNGNDRETPEAGNSGVETTQGN